MASLNLPEQVTVAIVGGGPVGLTLGCLLILRGIDCVVLESRPAPAAHSRAIGIHPPGFAVLAEAGIESELRALGVCIGGGQVFYNHTNIGRLSLEAIGKYPFVLSLPQTETERLLETRLNDLAPAVFHRGITVSGYKADSTTTLDVTDTKGNKQQLRARYVVGCDGKNSFLREAAGISFPGGKYPDCYLMGDFADTTPFGTDAALFVTTAGIVESFPLPGKKRRWVARLPERTGTTDAQHLARIIHERTGHAIPVATCEWISPFGIEYRLASVVYQNNCFLAGDAAHIVSPIGGQGMNLGLLDAAHLARHIHEQHTVTAGRKENTYQHECVARTRKALQRAYFNTLLGRPCPSWHPHRALVGAIVHLPPLTRRFADIFTMRDLSPIDESI